MAEAATIVYRRGEDELPARAPRTDGPPVPRAWAEKDPVAARRLARARETMTARAEELELPVENLLTPDSMRRLLWTPPRTREPDALATAVGDQLAGYGARLPKELMLYVKNMVFLDGAMARLAPELDIIGEITKISFMFAERHGERLGRELGIDHNAVELDMERVKAGLGVQNDVDRLTYRELQERRDLIQRRMRDHVGR